MPALPEDVADRVVEVTIVFDGLGRVLDKSHGEPESLFEARSDAVAQASCCNSTTTSCKVEVVVRAIEDKQIVAPSLLQHNPGDDAALAG